MQTRLELVASPEGDSKPGQVKMTVTNLGDADGQGSVILQVYPPAAGTITKQGQTEDPNMPADMDPAKLNTADKAAPKALEVKASAQIPCEFSLAPGASKTEVFDVTAWHPEIGKLAVETQPHGDGMIPTLLQFEVKNPEAATK
jgi:hypothetical protein